MRDTLSPESLRSKKKKIAIAVRTSGCEKRSILKESDVKERYHVKETSEIGVFLCDNHYIKLRSNEAVKVNIVVG